ncbi:MAG: Hsp70 family protein [Pseudonocardiaceae bacterium]
MSRQTIDFGIDLGTTNSAIAVLTDTGAQIIRNDDRLEFIPSAVWITKTGEIYVGPRAKARIEASPGNACGEFKLQMGIEGAFKNFESSGRSMTPEELSAEVLKSLRGNVRTQLDEQIDAAVITIPAAFELHQCDATLRAAERAGLTVSPLLQEPTAAAFAYSYECPVEKAFWLVYDFGGGTFDAAVISVRDGEFTVVNHSGDNFLGGKLIDWDIVDTLLIPALAREYRIPDVPRKHPTWRGNIAILKAAAEEGKIQLSSRQSTILELDDLKDENGAEMPFRFELTRAALERLAEPYYERSVILARRALDDARLGPADIEKVLLVGGSTLAPGLRERLRDADKGLGITLDYSLDPVTVVAQGAAIFAGTQTRPRSRAALRPGEFALDLEFEPIGDDLTPLVGGQVRDARTRDWSGFTIEFGNATIQPPWRSPRIPLTKDGAFRASLRAQRNTSSTFSIELRDSTGSQHPTTPAVLSYRHRDGGVIPDRPVLPHSLGVGLANNEMLFFIKKGAELPASRTEILRTTVEVSKADGTGAIRVPMLQGEQFRADRNHKVGMVNITPHEVQRDVPIGSEVQVIIKIDTSQRVTTNAYVPLLDEDWDIQLNLSKTLVSIDQLRREVASARTRLSELRRKADAVVAPTARSRLATIDEERMMENIDTLFAKAQVDPDAVASCEARLQELGAALDDVEDALATPELMEEIEVKQKEVAKLIAAYGDQAARQELQDCERETERARQSNDVIMLRRQSDVLSGIGIQMLHRTGQLEPVRFQALREARDAMTSPRQAARLIADGERALARQDQAALNSINMQLRRLLPKEIDNGQDSTVRQPW